MKNGWGFFCFAQWSIPCTKWVTSTCQAPRKYSPKGSAHKEAVLCWEASQTTLSRIALSWITLCTRPTGCRGLKEALSAVEFLDRKIGHFEPTAYCPFASTVWRGLCPTSTSTEWVHQKIAICFSQAFVKEYMDQLDSFCARTKKKTMKFMF